MLESGFRLWRTPFACSQRAQVSPERRRASPRSRRRGRRWAIVTPQQDGCVVVFDEQSEEQDSEVITDLSRDLSRELRCPVLALLALPRMAGLK